MKLLGMKLIEEITPNGTNFGDIHTLQLWRHNQLKL